ncbi:MAG: DUF3179 domain-containing protein [Thermodesulfobacteriota bacterium]
MRLISFLCLVPVVLLLLNVTAYPIEKTSSVSDVPDIFLGLIISSEKDRDSALNYLKNNWEPSFSTMLLEVIPLSRDPRFTEKLVDLLEKKTGENYGFQINKWYEWIWNQKPLDHPKYAEFKSRLYSLIDPRFGRYFNTNYPASIRFDEIRWGGVRQDGIPPLRNPKMISAEDADYLEDGNIVFGIEVNGDAKAYPKRILAWHEMFVDVVGGIPVAGVYCTLCGSMIIYKTELNGVNHEMGTSGFLYRSNKLMYDKATQSLWNTLWGRPVVGKLVDKGIELERGSVVTTTWGEWKKRHPDTKVLSLNTGHRRDYSEGAAYREYFATDDLMFNVPKLDKRLKNKDEVLGLVFPESSGKPMAISVDYLSKNPVYQNSIDNKQFVIFTDKSGAARVYESKDIRFKNWDFEDLVYDESGGLWNLNESKLVSSDGKVLNRLPAHRAFWFGWFSAFPDTALVN